MSIVNKVFEAANKDTWLTTSQLAKLTGLTMAQISSATYHLAREGSLKSESSDEAGNEFKHLRVRTKRPKGLYSNKALAARGGKTHTKSADDPIDRLLQAVSEIELELRELRVFRDKFNQLMEK